MYNTLKRLYLAGMLSNEELENAVTKKWITEKQKETIVSLK